MTPEEKQQLTEKLYNMSVSQLINIIIQAQEELQEAKDLRRRLMQIRNLATDPQDRRSVGRPKKGERVV